MKSIISCLICLFFLQTGCRHDNFSSPPKFTGYKNNPILSAGEPGSWDDLSVGVPQIIWYDKTFYLFYMGYSASGRMAVGLATSNDGVSFRKFAGNPVLASDNNGFDAFTVGPGIVLKDDTVCLMYYNCQELASYTPGPSVGRATAKKLTGPWLRSNTPVMTSGKKGEWDDGFIIPCSVLKLEDGSYRLYYTGGREISSWDSFYIGMAASKDGVYWEKFNDPFTTQHPFAESDPIFVTGEPGEWDGNSVWMANVTKPSALFIMYYSAITKGISNAIGYAESKDGIHWERYSENPVFQTKDDPFAIGLGAEGCLENPSVLYLDTICYMYYDHCTPGKIGIATARVH